MRRIILSLVCLITFGMLGTASAQTACTDLGMNLSRGAESASVRNLQNFLVSKGFLKAVPNGYFGPATVASVKAYQKSKGLEQVGSTGPGTRAAIKKDSCIGGPQGSAPVAPVATGGQPTKTATVLPKPELTSLSNAIFFTQASLTQNLVLQGKSFSTSTNTIFVRSTITNRRYLIATSSSDGTTLTLPKDIFKTPVSCGLGCGDFLQPGGYVLTVETEGGESNGQYLNLSSASISSVTGTSVTPIKQNATSTKIGSVTFSASVPVYLTSFAVQFFTDNLPQATISNVVYKDAFTGQTLTINDPASYLMANQSKIIDIYADVTAPISGGFSGKASVGLTDFVGKIEQILISPEFFDTVSGY